MNNTGKPMFKTCITKWLYIRHFSCGCVDVWMCGCVDVWMCGCVDVWMCGCVDVWMCGCVDVVAQNLHAVVYGFRYTLCSTTSFREVVRVHN